MRRRVGLRQWLAWGRAHVLVGVPSLDSRINCAHHVSVAGNADHSKLFTHQFFLRCTTQLQRADQGLPARDRRPQLPEFSNPASREPRADGCIALLQPERAVAAIADLQPQFSLRRYTADITSHQLEHGRSEVAKVLQICRQQECLAEPDVGTGRAVTTHLHSCSD